MIRQFALGAAALLFVTGFAGGASAASYGNLFDPSGTVSYENIEDIYGLFGAPIVSLNSLDFTPLDYSAQCSVCPSGSQTTDTLTMDIQASPGQQISEIAINEGLDYTLQSFDTSGFASVTVVANIFIDITQVNQVNVNGLSATIPVVFSPSFNQSVIGFGVETGLILGTSGAIDIAQIIADAGGSGEATRISISFDNTLTAFHDGSGGLAEIRKRDTDFVSLTINGGSPVPEPGTALLLMGGLAALANRKRGSAREPKTGGLNPGRRLKCPRRGGAAGSGYERQRRVGAN